MIMRQCLPDSSVGRALEVQSSNPGVAVHFYHPVTFGGPDPHL